MKLFELIGVSKQDIDKSLSGVNKTDHDYFEELKLFLQQHGIKGEELGDGLYSVVVSDQDQPGTVKKLSYGYRGNGYTFESLLKDGYFNYVMAMAENNRMDWNPYLPKIYSIKFFESKDNLIAFTIEMERLFPIEELSNEEIGFIGDKIFEDFSERLERQGSDNWLDDLMRYIEAASKGYGHAYGIKIIDSRFRHAMSIISKLRRSNKGGIDIHEGNIMFRRTPYGPQLVISDPLS